MWWRYIRYNDTYKLWLYIKWKLVRYGNFYVKYGKRYRENQYFKWKQSVNGILICQIWPVVEIGFICSIETIVICVTIRNVSRNVEGLFILEIETVAIREANIWRIKTLYTFRPAHRPPMPAHRPLITRSLSERHPTIGHFMPAISGGCISLPRERTLRKNEHKIHEFSGSSR